MPGRLSESNLDAVLFDVDGTLVDSLGMIIHGLGDTFEKFQGHRPSDETIRSLIGMPMRKQLGLFRDVPPTEAEFDEMIAFAINRFEFHIEHESLFEPSVQALREFHAAGVRTALVTSKDHTELDLFMKRFPAADCVHTVVCASDVTHPKPDSESATKACALLGVRPDRAIMIGDSVYDLRCARGAGVAAAAVTYGAGLRQDLLAEEPDLVIETPDDLLDWARLAISNQTCLERK